MRTSVVLVICLSVATTVYGDCNKPEGKVDNTVLISTDVTFPAPEGTSVDFGCEVGYRKVPGSGSGTVVCSGGQWTSLLLRCEKRNCGSAGEVLNGRVDYSEGTEFGAFARVLCNEGYTVVGIENQIYCGVNGWQGRLAECEAIICDPPNPIANGYFSPEKDEYEHSEVITYTCNGEYKLNGSRTASCQENRQFKPAPPTCVLVNCPEPQVENGVAASGARPPYKHLSSVTFRCKTGYDMVGQDTVSCDINSKWSPAFPKCNPIECQAPVIENGAVDGPRPTYKFDQTITVKCTEGYKLNGQSTLTCGERNQWSPALPKCTVIQCSTPQVEGGVVVGGSRPSYKYLDTVKFECSSGYILTGESTLTCDANGQWSPKQPPCTMIQCLTPQVTGGVVVGGPRPSYKYLDTVKFECSSGYTLTGESTLTCDANSQWSPKLPQCTKVECSAPEVKHGQVVEGSRPSYRYMDSVMFECISGYTMSGQSTLTCASDRQWQPELPKCTKSGGNVVKIVLIVLGVLIALLIIGCCIYCGLLKKKKRDRKQYTGASQEAETVALS